MVLAVDIGNTNIVMGCFDGTELKFRDRISTNQLATDLEYAATIKMALDMHGIGPSQLLSLIHIFFCRNHSIIRNTLFVCHSESPFQTWSCLNVFAERGSYY